MAKMTTKEVEIRPGVRTTIKVTGSDDPALQGMAAQEAETETKTKQRTASGNK